MVMPTAAGTGARVRRGGRGLNLALWVVQIALCALYLYTGWTKLVLLPMSRFYAFLGLCEFLGAIGLILPSALRIAPRLTAWAAAGLSIIMVGAVTTMAMHGPRTMLPLPIVALVLDLFVLVGRGWLAPIASRR